MTHRVHWPLHVALAQWVLRHHNAVFAELRQCHSGEFMCRDPPVCIDADRECDGYPDCEDSFDELKNCGQSRHQSLLPSTTRK